MKFTFGGIQYRLSFAHPTETRGKGKRVRTIRHTFARLITGETKETETIVAEGQVTFYIKDRYSLEIGRTEALEKMLAKVTVQCASAARTAYYNRDGGYMNKKEKNLRTQKAIKAVRRVLANRQKNAGWETALAEELVKILEPTVAVVPAPASSATAVSQ